MAGPRPARPSLRERLRDEYARFAARWPASHAPGIVAVLDAGEPVVLAGWQLARFEVPGVARGVHGFYRVEADGQVVEVAPQRDPSGGCSVLGWHPVVT